MSLYQKALLKFIFTEKKEKKFLINFFGLVVDLKKDHYPLI